MFYWTLKNIGTDFCLLSTFHRKKTVSYSYFNVHGYYSACEFLCDIKRHVVKQKFLKINQNMFPVSTFSSDCKRKLRTFYAVLVDWQRR